MKTRMTWALVTIVTATAFAQSGAPRGIEVADLNRNGEACTDFYEFANGAWRAANPIPASMSRWSRRWEAGEKTKDQLREILEQTSSSSAQPRGSVDQLTGDFYSACMDEVRINQLGARPLRALFAEIGAIETPVAVQHLIARFHEIAIAVPFAIVGESDSHNPSAVIAQIHAGTLGMPDRDYYVKTEQRFQEARQKYRQHVTKMFSLAGDSDLVAQGEAEAVYRLETRLAEASLDNVALRNPQSTDHKTSFDALQRLMPNFDWADYYRRIKLAPADINVAEPLFLEEVSRQLSQTPVADWKAYLKWHLLNFAAGSLSNAFVEEDFAFNGAFLGGAKEMKPRWKRCVESTDNMLGEALGKKYVEKHFPPAAKTRMQDLVSNLLLAMRETLESLDWMSAETKRRALEKLSTFNPKIGYPDKWKDYSQVAVTRTSYWDDVVAGQRFNAQDNRSTIGKPADRGRWDMTAPTSNAYYNPLLNEIVFPAGILQPPAFSADASDPVNYGAIGVVIGHEISHGFDDQGAKFDAQGRLDNWWTAEDLKKFQAKTACVEDQFDGYFVEPGLHHNGKLVLGESIGDLAGAKIAYRALQISRRGRPPLPTIDGFTPDQQFFIAWGQFRGDSVRPEFARTMIQGDPHPTGEFRVIGPLSNLSEFGKAFSCKPDAPMVRPANKRCEVW